MTPADRGTRRILYVTDGFAPYVVGGMQAYARRQLETLAAAGYDLVSISPAGDAAPTEGLPWRNIALPWPGRSALQRFSPWRYVRDLQRFSEAVAQVADEIRPHLIYAEGPLLHALLHRAERTAPTIFNPHGLEMFQPKGSLKDDLKSWPLRGIVADHARRADRTICLSETGQLPAILRDTIGVPGNRIAILPNAAPEPSPEPARGAANRFLFVGRDEPRKALPLLLDAFAGIEGAELDIVGAQPHALPTGVRAHGTVRDRTALARFYAEAGLLIVPSHAEGMPTVILEAFAAGLPVIATDVGANTDMVRDGETGFLIPRNDRAALRDAIRSAMALPVADHARMATNARALAAGPLSAETARESLLKLLDGMLEMAKDA